MCIISVQSVPTYSVTKLVTMLKSLTAREVFKRCPHVKQQLWGGEFWSDGYFATTGGHGCRAWLGIVRCPFGKHGDEGMIARYVKKQGNDYLKLHRDG
jgi:putative transposase